MTQTELLALAKSCGFTASAPLDPASIELKQAVRDMCQENTCGQYGKRWSCPPGCGNLEQCRTQLSGYSTGLLVQTTGAIEDSFDFEGIQAIEQQHMLLQSGSWINVQRRIWTAFWSIWNLETSRPSAIRRCVPPTSRAIPRRHALTWNGTLPVCLENWCRTAGSIFCAKAGRI